MFVREIYFKNLGIKNLFIALFIYLTYNHIKKER